MSYDVSLLDYSPIPRFDAVSYNSVTIEESANEGGPWTVIDTQSVAVDTDPSHPAPRNITTREATLSEGWYRVIWHDHLGGQSDPTGAVQNRHSGGSRPSIAEVATLLRARTKLNGGREAGTFTEDTRPTAAQVAELIDEAEAEVLGKVRAPLPEDESGLYQRRVRGAVRMYAAILIELSYFPEQVASGKSPASTYERLYDSRVKSLIAEGETGEPQGMGDTDGPADPAWSFAEPITRIGGW